MKFSHREDKRGDRLFDVLTDEENGLRLIVSRLGAELISLARRDAQRELDRIPASRQRHHTTGRRVGRITPPSWVTICIGLKNERSSIAASEIRGGTHSFLRTKQWHFVAFRRRRVSDLSNHAGRLFADGVSAQGFARSHLSNRWQNGVQVVFHFKNDEPELVAHVGFGLHPGFAATSFESFRFEMPAGLYRRHFSPDNYLSGETEDITFAGGEMPFAREKLPGSYILELVDVPDRTFHFVDSPSGRSVTLDLRNVPYLTLWSDGGAFFCVEPCWGLTDHHEQRAFEDKEGIQKIQPGGELQADFVMLPLLA